MQYAVIGVIISIAGTSFLLGYLLHRPIDTPYFDEFMEIAESREIAPEEDTSPVLPPTVPDTADSSPKEGVAMDLYWNFINASLGAVAYASYPVSSKLRICTQDEKRCIAVEVIKQIPSGISVSREQFNIFHDPAIGRLKVIVFQE